MTGRIQQAIHAINEANEARTNKIEVRVKELDQYRISAVVSRVSQSVDATIRREVLTEATSSMQILITHHSADKATQAAAFILPIVLLGMTTIPRKKLIAKCREQLFWMSGIAWDKEKVERFLPGIIEKIISSVHKKTA